MNLAYLWMSMSDTHQDRNLAQARGGPEEAVSFGASAETDKYLGQYLGQPC